MLYVQNIRVYKALCTKKYLCAQKYFTWYFKNLFLLCLDSSKNLWIEAFKTWNILQNHQQAFAVGVGQAGLATQTWPSNDYCSNFIKLISKQNNLRFSSFDGHTTFTGLTFALLASLFP